MDISQRGIDLILEFEGKKRDLGDGRFGAYLDTLAEPPIWTIYCGLTKGVHKGMVITEEQGDRLFQKELAVYEDAVERLITVPLNQNQFDALTSFTYNCGAGALSSSTLRRVLNDGKYEQVPAQLMRWVHAGGKEYRGLKRRRAAEAALFMEPVADEAPEIITVEYDGIPDQIENPMPQRVEEAPAGTAKEAIGKSWTIRGAALALLATLSDAAVDVYHWTTGVAQDAGTELTAIQKTVGPFDSIFFSMKSVLPILACVGIAIAIARRISAAQNGKIG